MKLRKLYETNKAEKLLCHPRKKELGAWTCPINA